MQETHLAQIKHLCPSAFEWRYTEAPASTAKASRYPHLRNMSSSLRPRRLIWQQHGQ